MPGRMREIASSIQRNTREVVGQVEQPLAEVKQRISDQAGVAAVKVE